MYDDKLSFIETNCSDFRIVTFKLEIIDSPYNGLSTNVHNLENQMISIISNLFYSGLKMQRTSVFINHSFAAAPWSLAWYDNRSSSNTTHGLTSNLSSSDTSNPTTRALSSLKNSYKSRKFENYFLIKNV